MKFSPEITNKIVQWKDALTAMPTDQFLEYAKMLLGEIETPFNKQKLVTQISTFFCQTENKKNIITLLGKNDLKIISLVYLIQDSTKESIVDFFSAESDAFVIRTHIQNLEERFILYTTKSTESKKKIYAVNPIIVNELGTKIGISSLVERSPISDNFEIQPVIITPDFLAAFISFSLYHPDLCKGDGNIKKKALKDFAAVCGFDDSIPIENSTFATSVGFLVNAFHNLLLFVEKDGQTIPDWKRLYSFAKLPEIHQYAYLCTAVFWKGHSRRSLNSCSQLLMDTIFAMEDFSYSRKMILRLGSIIHSLNQESEKSGNRFELLMAKTENKDPDFSPTEKLDQIIDAAIAFGLLRKTADKNGEEILKPSSLFLNKKIFEQNKKCVSVESGYSVTVMPGLPLSELLPLTKFLDIKRIDVASSFEINKNSVLRAFNSDLSLQSILDILKKYSVYEIPQSLVVSLEDWYSTFSSASFYCGYVLKLNESNAILVEKNKIIAPHILEKLAPGVLLLDFKNDTEASTVITQSGLTFIGKIKKCTVENEVAPLPLLKKTRLAFDQFDVYDSRFEEEKNSECEKIIQEMKEELEKIELTQEQKEGLLSRIERRIIVNKKQLQGSTVMFDKTEAFAMDNSGKVYIIEKAIQEENFLEITMDLKTLPYVGLPIDLDKKSDTVSIRQKNGNEITLPISAAVKIKKIRIEIQF